MSRVLNPSRRNFLKSSAAAGGGLLLGVVLPDGLAMAGVAAATTSMPNAWVRIGSDNTVTILSARSEIGQGVYTALPTLVAEELEVDLGKIKVEIAPAGAAYVNTQLGGAQITGGSTSVTEAYDKLRTAGAQARTMLIQAAAQKWGGGGVRLPRAERDGFRDEGQEGDLRRVGRSRVQARGAQERKAEGPEGLQIHRQAGSASGHSVQGERHPNLRLKNP